MKHKLHSITDPIKLVIWDLDDTFWQGTLEEGEVDFISENIRIVKLLTERGIVNSICSKNEYSVVKSYLTENGLWEYFVFPEISWKPKGQMVKNIINSAKLRANNVLFIDDLAANLDEVKSLNPGIWTIYPESIHQIPSYPVFQSTGSSDERLQYYKILEKKKEEIEYLSSNEEFLRQSEIRIFIDFDCTKHIDRIDELINRTNQLNFTKNRISLNELNHLLRDSSVQNATIRVVDRYGDYGIVGFFSIKQGKLIHFLFSCRVLNMGIEQWIYSYLKFPEIIKCGETAIELENDYTPSWIKLESIDNTSIKGNNTSETASYRIKCLLKGGCDLEQIYHYLKYENIELIKEFNYHSSDSKAPIRREHTEILKLPYHVTESEYSPIIEKIPFCENQMFQTDFFNTDNNVVIFSVLMDYFAGVYSLKQNNLIKIAYEDFLLSYTEPKDREALKERALSWSGYEINDHFFEWFLHYFRRLGPISEKDFSENICWIRNHLPQQTILIIINGSEVDYPNPLEKDRHNRYKSMNKALQETIKNLPNTFLLDVNKYISSKEDHSNHINHYKRFVYKQMADEILSIIEKELSVARGKRI
ncbi:hypothetical protein GCM10008014_30430 [Paenibacillus silvae]|uniref:HAD-IIIC family phosphatase n=1 Tax=Paenibacillus silvae TaxID=1325358 RepID=A0ABQ1ZF46_9BACL|nr:HAD-IIIC family phosphatase [Paenibacillus silvae]GGH58123.1 hypothetical protein GCM10008014_30430 [Paenibacillus silvae]